MESQTEIEWDMRTTLIDWLLQVHMRYHMLPETLWIAVNIIDRFLSKRVVSLVKFQLVGVTAMFVAAKYEEIMAPSVEEFVYMTENGYTRDDILKGEKILLSVSLFFSACPQLIKFAYTVNCPFSYRPWISKSLPTAPLTRGSAVSPRRMIMTSKPGRYPNSSWNLLCSITGSYEPSRA
jgi:hypothetical protein